MCWHQKWYLLFVCTFLFVATYHAEAMDFTILVHPSTGIKAETVKSILVESFSSRGGEVRTIMGQRLEKANAREAKDLKNLGEQQGLFLFFEAPTALPVTKRINGSLNSQPVAWHSYLAVYSNQSYSFWYRANGKDAPQFLGRGVIWGEAAQLTDLKPKTYSDYLMFTLSQESTAELHARALRSALREFKEMFEQPLGLQIFVAKGTPTVTSDGLVAVTKRLLDNSIPRSPLNPTKDRIPTVEDYHVYFPISRFKKQPDGTYQVEADLWNRLPIAIHGTLHRHMTRLETTTVKRNFSDDMIDFDLKPGEKKTVAFKVEAHPNLTAAMLQNNAVVVDWFVLGEGKVDKEDEPKQGKKKKK